MGDTDEQALFREAMRRLETAPAAVPDKDRAPPEPAAPLKLRRRRPPRARNLVVDDTLDLHHSRVEEALVRLHRFVDAAREQRLRTVIVITGKGHHSPGGESVIKREVERWIQRHGKRRLTAYSEAPARYGGSGAFVLSLRRS